jgi:CubicO group peptidase (beta-lactamase class C family)
MLKTLALVGVALLLLVQNAGMAAQTDPQTGLGRNVQSLLSEYHKRGKFSGTVLVTSESELDLEQGFGQSNRLLDLPNAADTCFKIGGITRSFTVAGILKLISEEKISLDDPMTKFFPESKGRVIGRATVQNLLSYTSGMPDHLRSWRLAWGMKFGEETPPKDGAEGVIHSILSEPAAFAPGKRVEFSNSAYMILGQIVEKVRGEPYTVWMRRFLDELGLKQTGFAIEAETTESIRAVGYEPLFSLDPRSLLSSFKRAPAQYRNTGWDLGASSMYSSGRDLQRWLDIINGDDFLPDPLQELLNTPVVRMNQSKAMGIAWELLETNGATLQAQVGAARGFYSITLRNPSTLSSIVVLSNFGESPTFRAKLLTDLATLLAQ